MKNILKFKHNDQQKVNFWGCTHIYHDPKWDIPIWKQRGYNSVGEHAIALKDKINNNCDRTSVLIHFGDGFLNSTPEQVEEYIFSLNTHICYLWGNHESSTARLYKKYKSKLFPSLSYEQDVYPLTYNNITFLGNYAEITVNSQVIICQHFPLKVWNYSKNGAWKIHSHNHGGLLSSLPNADEGKILDVGVDVFPDKPLPFDELQLIMNRKSHKAFDKHH